MLIGIDIIEITRIESTVRRTPRFLERVYTQQELAYCMNKKNPYPSLAVRFAAKEALRKLHQVLSSGIRFCDLEIVVDGNGKPGVLLHGPAREKCQEHKIENINISLSHSNNIAVAAVIAEKG